MKTYFKSNLVISELLVLGGRGISSVYKCNKKQQMKSCKLEVGQCQQRIGNYNNQIKFVIHINCKGYLGLKTKIILDMVKRNQGQIILSCFKTTKTIHGNFGNLYLFTHKATLSISNALLVSVLKWQVSVYY